MSNPPTPTPNPFTPAAFALTLLAHGEDAAAIESWLEELGAMAVVIEPLEDAAQERESEHESAAWFDEPFDPSSNAPAAKEGGANLQGAAHWPRVRCQAFFTRWEAAAQAGMGVLALDATLSIESLKEIADQDWVRETQAQFAPIAITPDFWIIASWHERPAAARRVIQLDPGCAFGTGSHPTTKLCLQWLAEHAPPGSVLDYGCGSGILAIAARRLGAQRVTATDIDPAALKAAKENCTRNAQAEKGEITLCTPAELARSERFDCVLANILAMPLIELAPRLCAHLAAGGDLLLSGLLQRQAQSVQSAYAAQAQLGAGVRWTQYSQEGWVLLHACCG